MDQSLAADKEDMELSAEHLMTSLLVSSLGFGIFLYGKKQARLLQLISGMGLMIMPYLISNWVILVVLCGVTVAGLWTANRIGL